MRVLVHVPTTGSANHVVRIEERGDLRSSQIIVRYPPLDQIARDYAALTAQAGPLARLGLPARPGNYLLRLAAPIETGSSWELPVLLAHLVVAFGGELVTEPSQADIVLWCTGAVDVDLRLLPEDYRLAAKVESSRKALDQAAGVRARIVAILPAGAEAPELSALNELLTKAGAQDFRMETVDTVVTARTILEQELGRTFLPAIIRTSSPPPRDRSGSAGVRGPFWKSAGMLAAAAVVAFPILLYLPAWTSHALPPTPPAARESADPESRRERERVTREVTPSNEMLRAGRRISAQVPVQPPLPVRAPFDPALLPARTTPPVAAERRVALVIGNSAYRTVPALPRPRLDAHAVEQALIDAGFQTVMLAVDLGRADVVETLRSFREEADRADWALIYYAGQGIESDGASYLIPVDAIISDDRDVKMEALSLEVLQSAASGAKMLQIVVFDARRGNPLEAHMTPARPGSLPGPGPGFVRVYHTKDGQRAGREQPARDAAAPADVLVVYSAKDGQISEDGDGVISLFAQAFVNNLGVPGLEVHRLFDSVSDDIMDATGGRQQPVTYGSLSGRRDYHFVAAKP